MATPAKRAALGTLAWATAKDGRLSRREQIRELAAAARVTLMGAPAQIRQRLGLPNGSAFALDPDSLPIPDSSIAKEAEELCRESSSEMLLNHCLRSYVWGMILGRRDGLRPDPELLYVASMLHDLALTDRFREYAPMPCFGARAGLLANEWARERGWEQVRCSTLADVISLHLNTAVPARHGPEAQLLQAGAGLDVIGLRHWELEPDTVAWVLERYPRHVLKATINPVLEAEAHPYTRTQLLHRWLLFGSLVRHSQFLE
jgi:hypothetical protein